MGKSVSKTNDLSWKLNGKLPETNKQKNQQSDLNYYVMQTQGKDSEKKRYKPRMRFSQMLPY